jgi:transcriptional regulator with XRE-family HTH domain
MSIGQRIKAARKAAGITQKALANKLGVSNAAISQWENDETAPAHKNVHAVAKVLNVPLSSLLDGNELSQDLQPEHAPPNVVPGPQVTVPVPFDMPRSLPVRGIAACSSGDGAFQFDEDVVDWARRPPALEGIKEAYALYCSGDSMEPRLFHGRMLIVHPKRPVHPGDLCVIVLRDSPDEPEYAYCKVYKHNGGGSVTVAQYNPPMERAFPVEKVVAIHRVLEVDDLFL